MRLFAILYICKNPSCNYISNSPGICQNQNCGYTTLERTEFEIEAKK